MEILISDNEKRFSYVYGNSNLPKGWIIHNKLLIIQRFAVKYWEGWEPEKRFSHTGWMDVVTPTDRPKSVPNSV